MVRAPKAHLNEGVFTISEGFDDEGEVEEA